jgi:cytochrome c oxidase cbb3-type subunit 2
MFNISENHKNLVSIAAIVFIVLSIMIAVIPASQMQDTAPLPGMNELSESERKGLELYVAENCVACHTQQVRNIEMDQVWGDRPSLASDYFYSKKRLDFWRQSPSLLGSERTGPDLTNVGNRQAAKEWQLIHLYNPRIVVKESIMPSYPWLFEERDTNNLNESDVVVQVPSEFLSDQGKSIVAKKEVLHLVDYLLSLKQADLKAAISNGFIPSQKSKKKDSESQSDDSEIKNGPDGHSLYMSTCAACHQADGRGIKGAFPSLVGSKIVTDENFETLVKIILQGYDARSEYGAMPPFMNQLSDEEIAAIATHERASWGNNASKISPEEVQKIRELIEKTP